MFGAGVCVGVHAHVGAEGQGVSGKGLLDYHS